MKNIVKTKNIPKLRFAGFLGEWEKKKIGEIFDIKAGGDVHAKNVSKIKDEKFKYPIFANSEKKNGLYGYSDIYKIDYECVTVTGRGALGVAVARFEKFYPIVRLLILKPKEKVNILFFENYINRMNFFIESTGVPQLTGPQISIYKLKIPKFLEQQKIASFLGSVDEWIENLRAQKESLEKYKKGMMQKLFPAKSGQAPEIRFKDKNGKNFSKWEEKKLGEINISVSDGNYGEMYPKASEMKNSGIPFIRANNIKNLKIVWDDMKYIGKDLHEELQSGHLKERDILITTRGDIGMLAYVDKEFNDANINAQICLLRCGNGVSPKFLLNYLSSSIGKKQFKELQTGSALKQLPKGNLAKIRINLPSFPEQQKIAEFLTSIDKLIESKQQQMSLAENWKKGLMQGLFI